MFCFGQTLLELDTSHNNIYSKISKETTSYALYVRFPETAKDVQTQNILLVYRQYWNLYYTIFSFKQNYRCILIFQKSNVLKHLCLIIFKRKCAINDGQQLLIPPTELSYH